MVIIPSRLRESIRAKPSGVMTRGSTRYFRSLEARYTLNTLSSILQKRNSVVLAMLRGSALHMSESSRESRSRSMRLEDGFTVLLFVSVLFFPLLALCSFLLFCCRL